MLLRLVCDGSQMWCHQSKCNLFVLLGISVNCNLVYQHYIGHQPPRSWDQYLPFKKSISVICASEKGHLCPSLHLSLKQTGYASSPPAVCRTPNITPAWLVLPAPRLAHPWEIQARVGSTCILQRRASPGTSPVWADGAAARGGLERYGPRCRRTKSMEKYVLKHLNDKLCRTLDILERNLEHCCRWRQKWNGERFLECGDKLFIVSAF